MPAPTAIPASLRTRPFTVTEARAAGLSDRMLRGQRSRRMLAYVYVCADVPDTPLIRLAAAILRAPHAFATDLTAAQVLGVPVPDDPVTYLGIRRGDPRFRTAGIKVREYVDPPRTIRHGGFVVTSPPQVFVQLADRLALLDLVVAGDAMVRRGHTSLDALRGAADGVRGRRGVRVRLAARSVRARVDSPMETWLRLLIVHARLPEPDINCDVIGRHGGWLARPDLAYPDWKIAIEYDGSAPAAGTHRPP